MRGRRLAIPLIVIGSVAVGGVAGAVLGVPSLSGASNGSTTVSPVTVPSAGAQAKGGLRGAMGDRFEAAAKALKLTPEQLKDKLSDGKTTIADVAKQQNVDIDDVIDAIAAADRKAIEDWVNKPIPHRPFGGMPGANKGSGPNGMRGGPIAGAFRGLDDIAKSLNTTPKELIQDLMSGKSIAQIAKDKGVDVNKLIDDAVAAANKRIDEAQSNGKITKEQAEKAKSTVRDAITKLVNGELPKFGGKGGFHLPGLGGGSGTP
jgi:ribosomal protein S20